MLAVGAFAWSAARRGTVTFESGWRDLIFGLQKDGWPRGVQEEDRDRPWGRPAISVIAPAPDEAPSVDDDAISSAAAPIRAVRARTRLRG